MHASGRLSDHSVVSGVPSMKYLFLILIAAPAFAKPNFTIMVKRKLDQSWYRLSQEKNTWICESNHFPFFEAKENPLSQLNWKELEKESKERPKECRDLVAISDTLKGNKKTLVTCLTQKETEALYVRISDLCRSKI